MRQLAISCIYLFITMSVLGQVPDFSVKRPTVKEVDSIERVSMGKNVAFSNVTIQVSSGYFPNRDSYKLGQPIMSMRETTPVNTSMSYYYSLPDSTIRLIEHSWNVTSAEKQKLNDIFDANARQLSKLFGNEGTTKDEKHATWSQKTAIWENDKAYIEQYMITGLGTYRVRVLVSWK